MTTTDTAALTARLERQRADLVGAAAALASAGEKRKLSLAEETSLEDYLADVGQLDVRLAAVQRPAALEGVRSEPLTYEKGGPNSFCLDVVFDKQRPGSSERLARHRREMDVELARRRAGEARAVARAVDDGTSFERRAIDTGAASAGYFVPPLWVIDEWGALGRATRPVADLIPTLPLPKGIQQVSIPRFTVNPSVAAQTADGASTTASDFTDAAVTSVVRTIVGSALVSQQLRDQSTAGGFDSVLFSDLASDYSMKLEQQVLNGSGASGQLLGCLNVSAITAVTFTSASPTVPLLLPLLGQAFAQFGSNRLQPPEVWVFAPRRWGWMASQLDTTNRPFVDLDEDAPSVFGTPAVLDGAMPLTLNTNQDAILAVKASDMRLFESELVVGAAIDHSGSGNLQIRLTARRYCALLAGRVPTAIAAVTGTGLAQQAGYG